MAFPVIIGPQSAVDSYTGKHFFQHTFHVCSPPTVLLDTCVPCSVKPEILDSRVAGCQFFQLIVGECQESLESDAIFLGLDTASPVRMTPVQHGEIEMYVDADCIISLYQFSQDIFLVRGISYRILCIFAGPQAKAFMVFGGYLYIFYSHFFGHFSPFLGIKLLGIPLFHKFQPVRSRNFGPRFQPFGSAVVCFIVPFTAGNGI